jgi:hypothetical protein
MRRSPTRYLRPLGLALITLSLVDGGEARADFSLAAPVSPFAACEQAGLAAEQANGLPPGLLLAIGRIESGRWDPDRGRTAAWPWTINAAGKGAWFQTPEEAIETTRGLLAGGTRSIDTGCFQINLMYHPAAFRSLEEAFDPHANATYAAHFLLDLFARAGTWEGAVEAYHSADPVKGFAYREQVFAAWTTPPPLLKLANLPSPLKTPGPRVAPVEQAAVPAVYFGVQVWKPVAAGGSPHVIPVAAAPAGGTAQAAAAAAAMPPLPTVIPHRFIPGR